MPRLSVVCSPPPSANAMMVTLFRPPLDDQTNVQDARCRRWKSSTFFSLLDHHSLSRGRDKFDRPFPICFFLSSSPPIFSLEKDRRRQPQCHFSIARQDTTLPFTMQIFVKTRASPFDESLSLPRSRMPASQRDPTRVSVSR